MSQTVTHNTNCRHNMYINAFYDGVNSLHVILGHVHHRCAVVACALTILLHFQLMDTGATGQSGQSAHGPVGAGCRIACASATIQPPLSHPSTEPPTTQPPTTQPPTTQPPTTLLPTTSPDTCPGMPGTHHPLIIFHTLTVADTLTPCTCTADALMHSFHSCRSLS